MGRPSFLELLITSSIFSNASYTITMSEMSRSRDVSKTKTIYERYMISAYIIFRILINVCKMCMTDKRKINE